jgi:hypothetical protein
MPGPKISGGNNQADWLSWMRLGKFGEVEPTARLTVSLAPTTKFFTKNATLTTAESKSPFSGLVPDGFLITEMVIVSSVPVLMAGASGQDFVSLGTNPVIKILIDPSDVDETSPVFKVASGSSSVSFIFSTIQAGV